MSAHVLLNLLNELGKEIKCEVCRVTYLFFRNEFDKFNNTRVRMLDSIFHDIKILKNCIFGVKTSIFSLILRNIIMDVITFPENL